MKRTGIWAAGLLVMSACAWAQQANQPSNPRLPASYLGPQLVAWSDLQKPQPTPQPLPPPERPDPTPAPQAQTPTQTPTGAQPEHQQQPATQVYTGTIMKDADKFVLKSEGTTYQIEDQDRAKLYDGKRVKITGSLDKNNLLHMASIEVVS